MAEKKHVYKVQFRMGEFGRTQEEYVTTKKSQGKPSKAEAKRMLMNRPAYSMLSTGEMNILTIGKVDEYEPQRVPPAHPGLM